MGIKNPWRDAIFSSGEFRPFRAWRWEVSLRCTATAEARWFFQRPARFDSRDDAQDGAPNQWEFQDPKMEVVYHIRQYFGDIPLHRPEN